ncbi:MAG TPA: FHA domain-containing protein [Anaerolineaceae bacterium]|jgi:DNA-binding response OmpR family regulator
MVLPEQAPFLIDPSGKEHLLPQPVASIGRGMENDIVIASKRVSREHACIRREGRRLILEDLNSTNGTFLNNERVLAPVTLRDGDQITIVDLTFEFHDPDTTTRETAFPELDVDLAAGVVRVNRYAISLSPKEFALLTYLYAHRGKVCSKDEIGKVVWTEYTEGIFDYQIENLVRRLRTKIEFDPNNPALLLTIRGLGYRLVGPGSGN